VPIHVRARTEGHVGGRISLLENNRGEATFSRLRFTESPLGLLLRLRMPFEDA
jgi:hypothetical protein